MSLLIPVVAIVGGFTVAIVGMMNKARLRELEVRERIAMIERGLVPPPEKDPLAFDRAMNRYERARGRDDDDDWDYFSRPRSHRRYRSGGITLMGVGLGLMVLIGSVGSVETGMGVGGFLFILGIAFFVNSLLENRQDGLNPSARAGGSAPISSSGASDSMPPR